MRRLLRFLRPYRHWAVLAPLLMVVEVAMDLMQPRLIQRIVDEGITQRNMSVVTNTGVWMLAAALTGTLAGVACTTFSVLASQGFGADLRDALFSKVQSLSFGNIDRFETGQLITRLTNDVTQVEQMVSLMLRLMLRAPLLVIGSLIMAVLTSPRLALMFGVLIPLIGIVLVWVIHRVYPLLGEVQNELDHLNTVMEENLAGVRVVKAFVRGLYELARFRRVNEELRAITVRAARIIAMAQPAMSITLNLGVVAAIWFGGIRVNDGTMRVGQIIAFVNYLTRTLWHLMFVSTLSMRIARAQTSAHRIQEILDSRPDVQESKEAVLRSADFTPQGRITFENVSFSYNGDGQDAVLKNISFVAEPGEMVAVLGATGAGKSSLVHLIPRFYDVTEGKVMIDGVDVRDIEERLLRRHIGVALQEPVLFSGTIRDNIRYGRPDASEEEVITAAQAAQADEFIRSFPNSYDTVLGQRGVNLSGGQKQRIAIARALLVQPKVLILDDSTSSVDVETEAEIQEALDDLMKQRTSFVIAQRISTVLNADKILVLDDGRIVAEGTHDELMASSEIYREIYDSQLGKGVTGHGD